MEGTPPRTEREEERGGEGRGEEGERGGVREGERMREREEGRTVRDVEKMTALCIMNPAHPSAKMAGKRLLIRGQNHDIPGWLIGCDVRCSDM